MECKWCFSPCIKAGFQRNGKQKYWCKKCNRNQQKEYIYKAYRRDVVDRFVGFKDLGVGIRKAAKHLGICVNTYQKWVLKAEGLKSMHAFKKGGVYDADEIQTFVGNKKNKVWISYAWNVKEMKVVSLKVGSRSADDLGQVIYPVLDKNPNIINTDNWVSYPSIIPKKIHKRGKRKANHIERQHVNLRKDVAYLIQETICFAKSVRFLEARLRWYFFGMENPYFFLKINTKICN